MRGISAIKMLTIFSSMQGIPSKLTSKGIFLNLGNFFLKKNIYSIGIHVPMEAMDEVPACWTSLNR